MIFVSDSKTSRTVRTRNGSMKHMVFRKTFG